MRSSHSTASLLVEARPSQPDLQYILNPGGNSALNSALVFGGRAAITI